MFQRLKSVWKNFRKREMARRWHRTGWLKLLCYDYEQAIMAFTHAIARDQTSASSYYYRGSAYCRVKDYAAALEDFGEALKLQPLKASYYQARAKVHAAMANYELAIADLDRAIELELSNYRLFQARARLKRQIGDIDGATADSKEAITLNPSNADACYELIEQYEEHEQFDDALALLHDLVRRHPTSNALVKRGLINMRQQNFNAAIQDFDLAIKMDKGTPSYAIGVRGATYELHGNEERALADYNESIRIRPTAYVLMKRGGLFISQQNYDAALLDLNQAKELEPRNARVSVELARLYFERGEYDTSLEILEESIQFKPIHGAFVARARIYEHYEKWDEAARDLSQAIEMRPGRVTYYAERIKIYLRMHEWDLVIQDCNEILRQQPSANGILNSRGFSYAQKGEHETALKDYDRAIEIAGAKMIYVRERAKSLLQLRRFDKAFEDITHAITLSPEDYELHNLRGIIHIEKNDLDAAIEDFTTGLRYEPKSYVLFANRAEMYFVKKMYGEALADFQQSYGLASEKSTTAAGLAVTHHALGNIEEALKLWRELVEKEEGYLDAEWVGREHHWLPPLVDEARKLIEKLSNRS